MQKVRFPSQKLTEISTLKVAKLSPAPAKLAELVLFPASPTNQKQPRKVCVRACVRPCIRPDQLAFLNMGHGVLDTPDPVRSQKLSNTWLC